MQGRELEQNETSAVTRLDGRVRCRMRELFRDEEFELHARNYIAAIIEERNHVQSWL